MMRWSLTMMMMVLAMQPFAYWPHDRWLHDAVAHHSMHHPNPCHHCLTLIHFFVVVAYFGWNRMRTILQWRFVAVLDALDIAWPNRMDSIASIVPDLLVISWIVTWVTLNLSYSMTRLTLVMVDFVMEIFGTTVMHAKISWCQQLISFVRSDDSVS